MATAPILRKIALAGVVAGALVWAYTPTRTAVKKAARRFKKDLDEREEELKKTLLSVEPAPKHSHRSANI